MPTISIFYGIVIAMYWDDHAPPHFHVLYADSDAAINIRTLEVLSGKLPRKAMSLVLEWAEQHKDELMEDWNLCAQGQSPKKISPLA